MMRMPSRRNDRGFTLIELLVVIAVIALLIGILLPSLAKARLVGYKVKSLANLRAIGTAGATYQDSYKGYLPLVYHRPSARGTFTRRDTGRFPYCSWGFGGANNNGKWAGRVQNAATGAWDIEAVDRPLNPFLSEAAIPGPGDPPATLSSVASERETFNLPIFQDPSDKASYQQDFDRTWNDTNNTPQPSTNSAGEVISSYRDVGTSYHANLKWLDQMFNPPVSLGNDWVKAWYTGTQRLRAADAFVPSRLTWVTDQYSDIVVYNFSDSFQIRNGYGDFNKSLMGFMDGHAAYHPVYSGGQERSFKNEFYSFVFDDLPSPVF